MSAGIIHYSDGVRLPGGVMAPVPSSPYCQGKLRKWCSACWLPPERSMRTLEEQSLISWRKPNLLASSWGRLNAIRRAVLLRLGCSCEDHHHQSQSTGHPFIHAQQLSSGESAAELQIVDQAVLEQLMEGLPCWTWEWVQCHCPMYLVAAITLADPSPCLPNNIRSRDSHWGLCDQLQHPAGSPCPHPHIHIWHPLSPLLSATLILHQFNLFILLWTTCGTSW